MAKFLFLLVFVPVLAFATKGGGGGIGIACYKNEELVSVEILDLYEAKALGHTLLTDLSGDLAKDTAKIAQKIYKHAGESQNVLDIISRYKTIRPDLELTLTDDAFPSFIPRGCKLKQVANYYNDSLIWIDKTLFDKMDYVNQLALAFHEYIYAQERLLGVPDSRYTRTIVGLAFSTQDPFELITTSQGSICRSADNKIVFNAIKTPKNGNIWKFEFITLNGHRVFSPKYGLFVISEDEQEVTYQTELTSKINPKERMKVVSTRDSLTLSWDGYDPKDKFRDVKVFCENTAL